MKINIDFIKKNIILVLIFFLLFISFIILNIFLFKENEVCNLIFTEYMSNNKGYYSYNNITTEYIEIYNNGNSDIDLKNYGVTDSSNKKAYFFESYILKPNEYKVIPLINVSFKMSTNETIRLIDIKGNTLDKFTVLDTYDYIAVNKIDNEWVLTNNISPGYENSTDGYNNYISSITYSDDIKINEILPYNKGAVMFNNNLYGYIEIINTGNEDINLKDYSISNDINIPFKYKLSDYILKPNEVYLIYTNKLSYDNNASFDLDKVNGTVVLSKNDKIVDIVTYENLTNGMAYIKFDTFKESNSITPGFDNYDREGFNSSITFNNDLLINEVMSNNNYLLSQNGNKYYDFIELYNNSDNPINLKDYYLSNDYGNKVMYNLPDVILNSHEYYIIMASGDTSLSNSSYYHANFKISSIEGLYLYKNNELIDSIFIYNIPEKCSYGKSNGLYYFDTPTPNSVNIGTKYIDVSNSPIYNVIGGLYNDSVSVELLGNNIYYTLDGSNPTNMSLKYESPIYINSNTTIKAISLEDNKKNSEIVTNTYIINEEHDIDVVNIIVSNYNFNRIYYNYYSDIEVDAYIEMLGEFSKECKLKIFGGQSREEAKKSFLVKFDEDLNYKLFDNRDAVEYGSFVLRSGSQDYGSLMFRDELVTSIIDDYSTLAVQAYRPVALYINNSYYGLYFIREKVNNEFIKNNYNVSSNSNIVKIDYQVDEGNYNDYVNLLNYIRNHDMSNTDNYNYVSSKLDIDSFIDEVIMMSYFGNIDIGNVRFFNNPEVDNNKIKCISYDYDYSLYDGWGNYFYELTNSSGIGYYKRDNTIIRGLLNNSEFKNKLLEKYGYYYKTLFNTNIIQDRLNYLKNSLSDEIKLECARWNHSYDYWLNKTNEVTNWLNNRSNNIYRYIKNYFGLSNDEMRYYFG